MNRYLFLLFSLSTLYAPSAELKAVSFFQETVSDIDGRVVKFLAGSTWLLDHEIVGVALGNGVIICDGPAPKYEKTKIKEYIAALPKSAIFLYESEAVGAKLVSGTFILQDGYLAQVVRAHGKGAVLETDDGSLWSIPEYDRYDTGYWSPPYPVIILKNERYLLNLKKGKKIWIERLSGSMIAGGITLLERAHAGDATAQLTVGRNFAKGDGAAKDNAEAVKWYRKAADQGNAIAQYYLADAYAFGEGVPKDSAEAVKWYRKAADQGNATAQYFLGGMYARGDGVPKDSTEAMKWYRKAAEQGHAKAQYKLGLGLSQSDGGSVNLAESAKWIQTAAETGDAEAQNEMGVMLYNGLFGVQTSNVEAAYWYTKAAEQGYTDSQFALGFMYYNGEGVPKNPSEAFRLTSLAAYKGHLKAQGNMAMFYMDGTSVSKDPIEALAWANISAASGEKIYVEVRDNGARELGWQTALKAQRRSRDILRDIEAKKTAR